MSSPKTCEQPGSALPARVSLLPVCGLLLQQHEVRGNDLRMVTAFIWLAEADDVVITQLQLSHLCRNRLRIVRGLIFRGLQQITPTQSIFVLDLMF